MGRKPRFSSDELLDAALAIALEQGISAVTMTAVASATGAPSGSLYHRFPTRDDLVGRLWLRTITDFQGGLLDALRIDDVDAAATAFIDHVFAWTRDHPDHARLLLAYSEADVTRQWPDTLAVELAQANGAVRSAVTEYARRRYGDASREHVDRVVYALVDLPYSAVRRHLPDGRPRQWLRDFTYDAARRVLAEG